MGEGVLVKGKKVGAKRGLLYWAHRLLAQKLRKEKRPPVPLFGGNGGQIFKTGNLWNLNNIRNINKSTGHLYPKCPPSRDSLQSLYLQVAEINGSIPVFALQPDIPFRRQLRFGFTKPRGNLRAVRVFFGRAILPHVKGIH